MNYEMKSASDCGGGVSAAHPILTDKPIKKKLKIRVPSSSSILPGSGGDNTVTDEIKPTQALPFQYRNCWLSELKISNPVAGETMACICAFVRRGIKTPA